MGKIWLLPMKSPASFEKGSWHFLLLPLPGSLYPRTRLGSHHPPTPAQAPLALDLVACGVILLAPWDSHLQSITGFQCKWHGSNPGPATFHLPWLLGPLSSLQCL